jgi:hypothetical protein
VKPEARRSAEMSQQAMQTRLALLDRRAFILVIILGADGIVQLCAPGAMGTSDGIGFSISSRGLAALATLWIIKASLATATLGLIAVALAHVLPTPWGPSVHQPFMLARGSWQNRKKSPRVEELAARFEDPHDFPGSVYDESLLRDLDHLATCVCWKRFCLSIASLGVLGVLGVGLAGAIIRVVTMER